MDRGGFVRRDTCAKQPAVRVRQPSAPIAASLPRRQPVVTPRAKPVSAGFSSRFSAWRNPVMRSLAHHIVQPRNAVCPSARSRRASSDLARDPRTPEPWVNGSTRRIDFPQEAPSTPMPRAAAASTKANGTKREWCAASLVDLVLLSRRDGQKH